jgi:hypothetical protein
MDVPMYAVLQLTCAYTGGFLLHCIETHLRMRNKVRESLFLQCIWGVDPDAAFQPN